MKVNRMIEAVKRNRGTPPDIILLQEARRTLFNSHIPGYNIIQRHMVQNEDYDTNSTKIQQPGTGNCILLRIGMCYNILDWGCWDD